MKISITYIDKNITQIFRVVDQQLYDDYRLISLLIPSNKELEKESKYPIPGWSVLSTEEQTEIIATEKRLHWINVLYKKGKLCTTESLIYKAYEANNGILNLPLSQGGPLNITTKLIEETETIIDEIE